MYSINAVATKIPGLRWLYQILKTSFEVPESPPSPFSHSFPDGHFYSPIPDIDDIRERQEVLFDRSIKECPGVDLNESGQVDLFDQLCPYYADLPFHDMPNASMRYHYLNDYFSYGEAIILFSIMLHFRPRRIIEVGSGYSSALMIDTNEKFLDDRVALTFIEPYPDRLISLLTEDDQKLYHIIRNPVQYVDSAEFDLLGINDILFIDSSHVVKIGSDVVHLLHEIIPKLRKGVIVHFHDIWWPFEYPKEWFFEGRAWNEAYFVRAFLQFNNAFEVMFYNSFFAEKYRDIIRDKMPLFANHSGSSLWLRKRA